MTDDTDTISKKRERLEALREDLEEAQDRDERLSRKIAEKFASGVEPNGLKEERRDVRELIEDLEAAIPVLESRMENEEREKLREKAISRLQTIKKQVGGLAGEVPRRAEEAEERAEELSEDLWWLFHASLRRILLRKEAVALAERFDLEVPPLKSFDVDPEGAATTAKRKVKGVSAPRDTLAHGDVDKVLHLLDDLFDVDSPTGGLLAEADEMEIEPRERDEDPDEDIPESLQRTYGWEVGG